MKIAIRKNMLEKRKQMSKTDVSKKSNAIQKKLLNSEDFHSAKNILVYMPINNEVLTDKIIKKAFSLGKIVVLPVVNGSKLKLSEINSADKLSPGKFGILEPKKAKPIKPEKIDLALIPGIAFDKTGNRIGYGKGYYDKLLVKIKVKKIALAFDFQVTKKMLNEHTDIPMDKIITERQTIWQ